MSTFIPKSMQAVLLEEDGGPLTVDQIPVPHPGPGKVLIRMAAAPINPSDLGFLRGSYGFQKPFPLVPGLERVCFPICCWVDAWRALPGRGHVGRVHGHVCQHVLPFA